MKTKHSMPFMSEQIINIQWVTPSRTNELKYIRNTSWWDRFLDRTTSFETANKSHYGNRSFRFDEWVTSSRTINPKYCWSEERAKVYSHLNSRFEPRIIGQTMRKQNNDTSWNILKEKTLYEDNFGNVKFRGIKVNEHKYK